MPQTKILCKCCSSEIGSTDNISISFALMKAISKVEYDFTKSLAHIKCRCGSWNTFDSTINQIINYQKKAQEHLFSK